jgi:hypothetical protein
MGLKWAVYKLTGTPITAIEAALAELPSPYLEAEYQRPTGRYTPPQGTGPLLAAHVAYLQGRGFDAQRVAALWGVQGIGMAPRLPWSLFIPVFHNGKPVSWTTRSINPNSQRRYRTAEPTEEQIPIRELLYGEEYCRNTVVVHEGPTDVWATGPGAVATFGIDFTAAQVQRLSRYWRRVVCFDGQPAAQAAAMRLVQALRVYEGETLNVVLQGKDTAASPLEAAKLRATFLEV